MARDLAVERIALLSLHSSPLAPFGSRDAGGMNVYVGRLADELAETGRQVDVFTRRTDPRQADIIERESGARVVHVSAGPARSLPKSLLPWHVPAMVAGIASFMQREQISYDLLHSHYWLSGLVGLELRETIELPLVHMFHTLSRVKEFYFGRPDPSDTLLRYDGERSVIDAADVIVGATEGEGELIEKLYGRHPERFVVIPPGVDIDTFRPVPKEESRRQLGIDAEQVILFVGRLDPIKGLDVLLRALAALQTESGPRRKLIVAGQSGTPRQASVYRTMVRQLGLSDVVEFCGLVPQELLPLYYSAADVCAVPSAYESFGLVAVEAMACATPVVAFRVGGLAETVRDGLTGFLAQPGSRQDFTAKLRTALTSDSLEAMGKRAHLAVQRYTWSSTCTRTLDLYHEVVRDAAIPCRPACGQRYPS